MQHRGLVLLAFSRGISEPEWNAFLEIMSAPPVEKTRAEEGKRLARALLEQKVTHVAVAAALRALDQDLDREETVQLLLTIVMGKAPDTATPVFVRQVKHKSPRVRRDALTALTSANHVAADEHMAEALADPDENVRIRALLLCAGSPRPSASSAGCSGRAPARRLGSLKAASRKKKLYQTGKLKLYRIKAEG